jgi:hypothetical protein
VPIKEETIIKNIYFKIAKQKFELCHGLEILFD